MRCRSAGCGPGATPPGCAPRCAPSEPQRRLDLLLAGAIIEARSCERFALLAPRLPAPLGTFYAELGSAEARHGELYLDWAQEAAATVRSDDWRARLRELAGVEAGLIGGEDVRAALPLGAAGIARAARLSRARRERGLSGPGQRQQLEAALVPAQEAALLVPGAEHVAPRGRARHQELVHPGPVRMAVDQRAQPAGAQHVDDRGLARIHDVGRDHAGVRAAAGTRRIRERAPRRQRQSHEATLPGGVAHHAAQALVGQSPVHSASPCVSSTRSP